jgi:hypothetical protein
MQLAAERIPRPVPMPDRSSLGWMATAPAFEGDARNMHRDHRQQQDCKRVVNAKPPPSRRKADEGGQRALLEHPPERDDPGADYRRQYQQQREHHYGAERVVAEMASG